MSNPKPICSRQLMSKYTVTIVIWDTLSSTHVPVPMVNKQCPVFGQVFYLWLHIPFCMAQPFLHDPKFQLAFRANNFLRIIFVIYVLPSPRSQQRAKNTVSVLYRIYNLHPLCTIHCTTQVCLLYISKTCAIRTGLMV